MKHPSLTFARAAVLVMLAIALVACGTANASSNSSTSITSNATPLAALSVPSASSNGTTAVTKLNLNTASQEALLTVPNAGSRMVREFMEYRPYTSITQFRRELGKYIDQAQITDYEQYLYVPVDVNQADAATLMQLPGVTDSIAADLIAGRPYASTDAFLAKLAGQVSAEQLAMAPSYLVTQ